jgi:hypothetical protein
MIYFIYLAFIGWAFYAAFLIYKVYKEKEVNLYIYSSIPNVFTTIGVLGTFLGIYLGLQDFDTNNINKSIPTLLEGLKSAFTTSIIGITLSILFGRVSEYFIGLSESKSKIISDEALVLNNVNNTLERLLESNNENFEILINSIISDKNNSLSTELKCIKEELSENNNYNKTHVQYLESLDKSHKEQGLELRKAMGLIGGNPKNSVIGELQKLNVSFEEKLKVLLTNMKTDKKDLHHKFDGFAKILAENNTEALVDVMKKSTEEFNKQMSKLINKLVQENFKELNNSVKQLNTWQIENKNMVSDLTNKHKETVEKFNISSKAIEKITKDTSEIIHFSKELIDEKGKLQQIINAIKNVIVDDKRFENSTKNLLNAIDKIDKNIDSFDKTTHKLNDWIKGERSIKQNINALLIKLDEVSNIKSYNGEFWNQTKKQLNEGTSVIASNTKQLSNNLNDINREFQTQLGEILESLDLLIKRLIQEAKNN